MLLGSLVGVSITTCMKSHFASDIISLCSDFKAKQKKRRKYNRHYAFKGRGRKEYLMQSVQYNRSNLTPMRAACNNET